MTVKGEPDKTRSTGHADLVRSHRRGLESHLVIVDNALRRPARPKGRPVRVGLIGAGFMARGLTNRIVNATWHAAGGDLQSATSRARWSLPLRRRDARGLDPGGLEDAIGAGHPVVTDDATLLARLANRCLVDPTGAVEFGARVVLDAFAHGKDVVLMNAELDATIGPILQVYAKSTAWSSRPATATSPASR